MTNADALRKLIRERKLKRARVAELCDVSIHTVNAWLMPRHAHAWRNMPDSKLRLLRLELLSPSI
jgi:hypothetical protein